MWILRGVMLGLLVFSFGSVAFFLWAVVRPAAKIAHTWSIMVSSDVLRMHTVGSPYFWIAFVACLTLCCALVGAMPAHRFPQ